MTNKSKLSSSSIQKRTWTWLAKCWPLLIGWKSTTSWTPTRSLRSQLLCWPHTPVLCNPGSIPFAATRWRNWSYRCASLVQSGVDIPFLHSSVLWGWYGSPGRGPLWQKNLATQCPCTLHHGTCQPGSPGTLLGAVAQYCWQNTMARCPESFKQRWISSGFNQEPGPDTPSELEQATEDIYRRQVKDEAQRESDGHSLPPSCADGAEIRNSPGLQPPSHEGQQSSQPPEQEDRPHKFQPRPDWHMVTPSSTGSSTVGVQPGLDPLDQELGKDDVNDILGNYLEEQQSAVRDLTFAHNPGLTRSESPEAMDVDLALPSEVITDPPLPPIADTQDQAMETEPPETSLGTFQPELGMPSYTPSLIGSANTLPSPITRPKIMLCWMLTWMCRV